MDLLCFHFHCFVFHESTRRVEVPSSRIVIIEGIYALSEKLRPLLDLRVSVTGGVHFDLVKRVLRDIQRAGQEPEEIIQQISETVKIHFCSSFAAEVLCVIFLWFSFETGISHVQGIYRAESKDGTHKNHQQV